MSDLADLAFHEVEIVEKPLGGGRNRLAASHVAGQDVIRVAERARVLGESAQQRWGTAPRVSRECEPRGQRPGALLQPLDAEELTVQGAGVEPDQRE